MQIQNPQRVHPSDRLRSESWSSRLATKADGAVFIGLLFAIVLAVVPYGTVDAWWEGLFEAAVFAITAIWLGEVVLRGEWRLKKISVFLPLALVTAYAFVQMIDLPAWLGHTASSRTLTIDRYQTYLTARKTLALTLFAALLLLHTTNPRRLHWVVRSVLVVGLGSALFALLRQALQPPDSTIGFGLPFLFYGVGYGQFISPNVFAYVMEITFGLTVGLILGGGIRKKTLLISVSIALIVLTALVLSNSRGGILSLICQIVFLISISLSWFADRRRLQNESEAPGWISFMQKSRVVRVFAALLIATTIAVGVLWLGGDRLGSKLYEQDTGNYAADGTTRKEIWQYTWTLIKHHPLTGVGFGAYALAIPEWQVGSGRIKVEQAHNDYLDLIASGGIVGGVLGAWFAVLIILRARMSFRSPDPYRRASALGAMAGILGVAVHSLVDFSLQVTGIAVLFAALLVIAVADRSTEVVKQRINAISPV